MQVFEVIACHVGINLSRGDVGMAQHGLNRPQIGAAFQQVARKGVPQRCLLYTSRAHETAYTIS